MFSELENLNDLMLTDQNSKKKRLHNSFVRDINNLISKYEYMYYKYVIGRKKIGNLKNEDEKHIAIVQKSMEAFFPYILAHNIALISNY